MYFTFSIFNMIFYKILRWINNSLDQIWLIIQIIWQMHVHYLRLFNIKILVDKYFETWKLIHFPKNEKNENKDEMRFRTITLGRSNFMIFLLELIILYLFRYYLRHLFCNIDSNNRIDCFNDCKHEHSLANSLLGPIAFPKCRLTTESYFHYNYSILYILLLSSTFF